MRKSVYVICEQQRRRSAFASPQSDQRLRLHYLDRTVHILANFKITRLLLASEAA